MSSERPLAGQSALVTGASRGIGEAVARRLADAGARVHLLARRSRVLDRLAAELGGRAWTVDLADQDTLGTLLSGLVEEEGAPDVLVNAAGVFDVGAFAETPIEVFDRALYANLRGPFLVIRALLPAMLARGTGTIVTIGSVAGHRAFPGNAAYSASKYGLRGLLVVLGEELRGTGVRSTLVEPAATD
ncbi:MAG: SDR family oxidoreductase, partial [Gemmatimonadetes bacterium]|nr:SDR family oxidoreductase [Gemmatimonadota bacterium]